MIKDVNKEKIIVLEEPENHLFPLLQKQYAALIDRFEFGQSIMTTHSPSIIDFRKTEEILKFKKKTNTFEFDRVNIDGKEIYKDFGYSLNEEIAEAFFYDEVLLIEGYAEKLFYNMLVNVDENFRLQVLKKSLGFICVYGVDFAPSKKILQNLGIKVHVLTDNDFHGINNERPDIKRYAGLQRSWEMLTEQEKKHIKELLNSDINKDTFKIQTESNEHNWVKENMTNLIKEFHKCNIYINDNHEDGFEGSFTDFIGTPNKEKESIIKKLKIKKMKNLHKYIIKNEIILSVNEQNKKNILVKFIYE